MLVVMKPGATEADFERVREVFKNFGCEPQEFLRGGKSVIGVEGQNGSIDSSIFQNITGVAETISSNNSINLTPKNNPNENFRVRIGDAEIGGSLTLIAGVCSVESREQVFTVAETVKKSGAKFFRGGAFKPRTSPYAFQGLGEEGLKILAEVRKQFGLKIVTEAIDENAVDLVEKYGDIIQIGSRNMQNFSLLKRAGRSNLPVLLKRGMSATLEEFLLAAEYILAEGNKNVVLCERGIRTFANHSRNTLDLSIVPAIRKLSHLPIIVDPSHGTGKNYMVAALARAGVAVGADGIMVEIHPEPEKALSDGAQALLPQQYLELVEQIRAIYEVLTPISA